jgi:hypothetical protein
MIAVSKPSRCTSPALVRRQPYSKHPDRHPHSRWPPALVNEVATIVAQFCGRPDVRQSGVLLQLASSVP